MWNWFTGYYDYLLGMLILVDHLIIRLDISNDINSLTLPFDFFLLTCYIQVIIGMRNVEFSLFITSIFEIIALAIRANMQSISHCRYISGIRKLVLDERCDDLISRD